MRQDQIRSQTGYKRLAGNKTWSSEPCGPQSHTAVARGGCTQSSLGRRYRRELTLTGALPYFKHLLPIPSKIPSPEVRLALLDINEFTLVTINRNTHINGVFEANRRIVVLGLCFLRILCQAGTKIMFSSAGKRCIM